MFSIPENVSHFDIRKIAESGQCFRFEKTICINDSDIGSIADDNDDSNIGDNVYDNVCDNSCDNICDDVYDVVSGGRIARVSNDFIICEESDCAFWHDYFAFGDEPLYDVLHESVSGYNGIGCDFLKNAENDAFGIRILKQDPWEALVSFIISQNNNIPRIKKTISGLCAIAGEKKWSGLLEREYVCFPDASQILEHENELSSLKLGYRESYIVAAAEHFSNFGFSRIDSVEKALQMRGVGPKVAACYGLYGLHELNEFPVDTWIKKILQAHFGGNSDFLEFFPEGKGILQQYMFYAERKG